MAYQGTSIVDYLKSEGRDSSFSARRKLAGEYGISAYRGTAAQNTKLLGLLRQSAASAAPAAKTEADTVKTAPSAADTAPKPQYSASAQASMLQQSLADKEQAAANTAYTSPYGAQIEALLANVLAQKPFSYDPSADPLYHHYAAAYTRGGKQAMEDTLASAAALTGGYGSSYATRAGQQAYQQYLQELSAMVPALYDSAYARYRDAHGDLLDQLGLLQGLEGDAYARHRDSVADAYADLNYYYTKYNDLSDQEYAAYLKDLEQWNRDRDFLYAQQQDALAQSNWQAEHDLALAKAASKGGGSSKSKTSAKQAAQTVGKASASASAAGVLSKDAIAVLSAAQALYDPAAKDDYVNAALKKGTINAREAQEILKKL